MDLLAAAPVLRLAPLEDAVAGAAKALALDVTLLKFAVALYGSVALSAVNGLLPSPAARHAYAVAAGLLLYQFVFGAAYAHALAVAGGWYALMAGTARVRALDGWRHLLAALLSFAALSVRHLYRQSVTATNVDDSVVHMMLAVRLYTLAYNLHDGAPGEAGRLACVAGDAAASAGARTVAADRLARAVPALPSPLAFAGYVLNPATLLVGPALEYTAYAAAQARPGGAPPGAPPRAARVAYCLATGTAFLAAQVLLGPYVAIDGVYAQAVAPVGGGRPHPLWRLAYMHAAVLALRAQYYGVWRLSEGACVLGGFGYRPPAAAAADTGSEGPGPAGDWGGAQNVVPARVDLATSSSEILRHWNMHTQSWLERYVFKRAPRPWNRWATFFASAFWHGFYPGYYISFVTLPLLQEALRVVFALGRPAVAAAGLVPANKAGPAYRAWTAAKVVLLQAAMDYALVPFCLLDARRGLAFWASWGYAGHIVAVALLAASALLSPLPATAAAAGTRRTPPSAVAVPDAAVAGQAGLPLTPTPRAAGAVPERAASATAAAARHAKRQ